MIPRALSLQNITSIQKEREKYKIDRFINKRNTQTNIYI